MRVLLNAVSAKMGGAANYIRHIASELENLAPEDEFICIVPEGHEGMVRGMTRNLHVIGQASNTSYLRRVWFEQVTLRRILRREKIDVLYSTANFGMVACPCRQVLLVRNLLYFSSAYEQFLGTAGLKARLENMMRRWLVCRSVKSADTVLTPSQAMLDALLERCPGARGKAVVNRYGVTPSKVRRAANKPYCKGNGPVTLLYTSLYADYKNVGTLLKAVKELVKSGFDCKLVTPADPNGQGPARTAEWRRDSQLACDSELRPHLEFTGILERNAIAALYGTADVFVYASIIESFGHPLLEAMAAGLPVVAADASVNRELCGNSALYFSPYDSTDCSRQIRRLIEDSALANELSRRGVERSHTFQWQEHGARLIEVFANHKTGRHRKLIQESTVISTSRGIADSAECDAER